VLGVVVCVVCVACGSQPARDASTREARVALKIGLLLDDVHERWERDRALIAEVVDSMGAELMVEAAEGDQGRQDSQADLMLASGVKTLIIVAHDTGKAAPIVEKAKARGVKVISYDRLIANADVDLYLGFDAANIGQLQAQYLLSRAPKGNYVLIGGAPSDGNAKAIREGHLRVLEPAIRKGAIRIVGDGWAENWQADAAGRLTTEALDKARNRVVAIVASNDVTAGGAIEVLRARGLAGKVLVSGQDAELAAAQRIADGEQAMTVYKSLRTITRLAARSAVLLARGETVDTSAVVNNGLKDVPAMLFDPITIDRDNLEAVLIGDGLHRREDVFRSR
jgi:D-xylose transport system substrate-binding protein